MSDRDVDWAEQATGEIIKYIKAECLLPAMNEEMEMEVREMIDNIIRSHAK